MIQVVRKIFFLIFLLFPLLSTAQVKFCAVGDILLDRGVRRTIEKTDAIYPFRNVEEIINKYHLAFGNLECPICPKEQGFAMNKRFSFRADSIFVDGLKFAGFNILSIANNHTVDYGNNGFLKTIEILKQNNIHSIGGGKNQQEAFNPVIIEENGQKFAFFANLQFLLEGLIFMQDVPYPAFGQIDRLCDSIEKYNSLVDFVIVSFHWGIENCLIPTNLQINAAHNVVDAGADIVLGHHPHVLQPIEIYNNGLILYSLGNFVFDNSNEIQKQSIIFSCNFKNGLISETQLIPIKIVDNCPQKANNQESKKIFEHISKKSQSNVLNFNEKDNKISILFNYQKVIKELKFCDIFFKVFEDSIVASAKNLVAFKLQDSTLKFCNDASFCNFNDTILIFSILKNKFNNKSQIVIVPFNKEKEEFLTPSIDVHDYFNPWKLDICDIDNDKKPELIVGVHKATRYFKRIENRIFVFNIENSYIYPKWLGSKIGNPIIDFSVDHQNKSIKITEQTQDSSIMLLRTYKWNGFGFDLFQTIDTIFK